MKKAFILIAFTLIACDQSTPQPSTNIEGLELTFTQQQFSSLISAMKFTSELVGHVGTGDGNLYKTKDGGETWKELFNSTHLGITDFYFENDKKGWAIGEKKVVLQTTNGGESWHTVSDELANEVLNSNWFAKPDIAEAATFDALTITDGIAFAAKKNEIYRSSDLGESWMPVQSFDYPGIRFRSLNFVSDRTGFALGAGEWGSWSGSRLGRPMGAIYYTTDGGQSWKGTDHVNETGIIATASFPTPTTGYATDGAFIVRIKIK